MSSRHMTGGVGRRTPRIRGELKSLVRFEVGETCYAFEVANIEEVVHPAIVTPLAHMGEGVAGVFDHRGRVTPIVDLRPRFGLAPSNARTSKWILMRTSYGLVGFMVDRVLDVVPTSDDPSKPPNVGPGAAERAIRGVVTILDRLVFLLDESRLAAVVGELELPGSV